MAEREISKATPMRRWVLTGALAWLCHLLVLVAVVRWWPESPPPAATPPPPSVVETIPAEDAPPLPPQALATLTEEPERPTDARPTSSTPPALEPPAIAVPRPNPVEAVPEPEVEPEPEVDPEPEVQPEPEPERLRSVAQPERDNTRPDEANYLAEVDNATDVETMAEQAVADSVEDAQEMALADSPTAVEPLAASAPAAADTAGEPPVEPPRADVPEPSTDPALGAGEDRENAAAAEARDAQAALAPVAETPPAVAQPDGPGPAEAPAPSALEPFALDRAMARAQQASVARVAGGTAVGTIGALDPASYVDVFGDRNRQDVVDVQRQAREGSIAGDHTGRWERTRAALENFDVDVAAGSETRLNTHQDIAAGYIHHLHNKIHTPWRAYLERLSLTYGGREPLADLSIAVELEYVINANGGVEQVNIRDGSGVLAFDAEAVDLFYRIGPHEPPPPGLRSGDGNTYIVWLMRRDGRACSTSHASVRWRDFGGEPPGADTTRVGGG
jgi:TonB family protein